MPPSYNTTALNALRWLPGGNLISDIDAGFQALAEDVDARLGGHGYAEVNTSQTTTAVGPADLATAGPSVTVTLPTNGIVVIRAQATLTIAGGGATASVYLDEDGVNLGAILSTLNTSATTVYTAPGSASGSAVRVRGGALEFPAAAGSHTYKLRYGSDGFQIATFATRRLWVAALPS